MKFSFGKRKSFLFVVFFVLIILCFYFFKKEIKNFFYIISNPIQKVLWQAGKKTSDFFETVFGIGRLKKENEDLKIKIQENLTEIANLKELETENQFLREALEINLGKDFALVLVQVSQKDIGQDTILINKGSKDGILKGLLVITAQKSLVGKISEVYQDFSKVSLIFNKESSFNVKIAERETLGIIKGRGDSKVFLELIPKEAEIKKEDLVITTPLDGTIPKGLLVGKVKEIKVSDVKPFQEADIEPLFDFENLSELFVIKDF